ISLTPEKARGHRPRLQGPLGSLAVERIARHVGVPVNERTGWVLLPGPDMQSVKGGKSETIGTLDEMKELSHQLRRTGGCCIPSIREHEIVGADQAQASVRQRFVDYNLGTRRVQNTVRHQGAVHEVHAHCPRIGSTDATELQVISRRFSY